MIFSKIPAGFETNEEIELGVVIGKEGKFIKETEAMDYVAGYCAALDLTSTSELVIFVVILNLTNICLYLFL